MSQFACVDIGYGYLKYINKNKVVKEKAVIAELGESLNAADAKGIDIFVVDGIEYIVGDSVYKLGKKPIVANESTERGKNIAYKVMGLFALAKITNGAKCTLVTGLPYQNLDEADLVKSVFTGTHNVVLNGVAIELNVEGTTIVSQGLGTFYSLVKQRGTEILKKKILLVDIGFRTINYLPLIHGDIDKDYVRTSKQMGIQDSYIQLIDQVNKDFKRDFKFYEMDELLDKGVSVQDLMQGKKLEKITSKPYVSEIFSKYAATVWEDFLSKYDDKFREELDEVIFAGGSAERVQEYLSESRKHFCTFVENSQDVQVQGYAIIADKLVTA